MSSEVKITFIHTSFKQKINDTDKCFKWLAILTQTLQDISLITYASSNDFILPETLI